MASTPPIAGTPWAADRPYTLQEAMAYCRKLATSHYENFLVTSLFTPKQLRPHFHSVYAFCRIADDLADETGDPDRSLSLLDWWEDQLRRAYEGRPEHPAMVALDATNNAFGIPISPYLDLLHAFRQDQVTTRYATYHDLLDYCAHSANPVGRLTLHLFSHTDSHRRALSDAICTGLQLANFWQDLARDAAIGRVYLPENDMAEYGVRREDLLAGRHTPELEALLTLQCSRAAELFDHGSALVDSLNGKARLCVAMFVAGGREILQMIADQRYDVLTRRPAIPRTRQLRLLASTWLRSLAGRPST